MEHTHYTLGQNRRTFHLIDFPVPSDEPIKPRLVAGTRWILLHPDLQPALASYVSESLRSSALSASTWQCLRKPMLVTPTSSFTDHFVLPDVYNLGSHNSRAILVYSSSRPREPVRLGSTSIITLDRTSLNWVRHLVCDGSGASQAVADRLAAANIHVGGSTITKLLALLR